MANDKGKWDDVFEAHPDETEIFIGTNENGEELAFLANGQAQQFCAKGKTVQTVKRPLDKAAKEAEAAAKKQG